MKAVNSFFPLVFFILFVSCNKIDRKTPLLIASQKFTDLNKIEREFTIYSDSTYIFKEIKSEINYNKMEKWEGKVKIYKNNITFTPFPLSFNGCESAILKNGFIEFSDGEYPDRMKIVKTSLSVKNNISLKSFRDYAIFTFYENHHNSPEEKEFVNYDFNTAELIRIDSILKKEFKTNKKLKDYNDYLKQIVVVRNFKNEILIQAHLFCRNQFLLESYEYYQISMMDGGNCNIYIELNLTTGKFNSINIAGMA